MHRRGVDIHVVEGDIGIVARAHLRDGLAPQAAGFQHIGLVDRGETAAPQAGLFEGDAGDAGDLRAAVGAGVGGLAVRALAQAEIDAAGQLAHDQQVRPRYEVGSQRGLVRQRGVHAGRSQIGIDAERLAQGQKAGFGARGGLVPFGSAHCAEEDRVGGLAGGQGLVGQGFARTVRLLELHREAGQGGSPFDDGAGDAGDFRADPVTGQKDDAIGHAVCVS